MLCITANTSATCHVPPTNLLLLAAEQEPYKKSLFLNEKYLRIFWKRLSRMDQQTEKKDRKSNRTRQNNKRVDSKVESNCSPEIPDRWKTSDIPGLPSGASMK